MTIRVRYFASLRDRLGRDEDHLDAGAPLTVGEVWTALWPDAPIPPGTRTAVNLRYCPQDRQVADGDEVAFLPPVTGG